MNLLASSRVGPRRRWLIVHTIFFLGALLSAADAYVLEGIRWPNDQPIVLDLQLGSPQGTLIDGSTSWDQVITAATNIWNPYIGSGVQFKTQETNFTPAQGDGKNSVFFATSVFGEGFGDDTLATTAYLYNTSTGVAIEADIVYNVAQSFNSYRGPLRTNGNAPVYDLRRITLHELGHVLGLAHVPQTTQAIMTPVITDIDTIQADDIAGVESIYGNPAPAAPVIEGGLSDGGVIGEGFEYQISATNDPISYGASPLPPGLRVNAANGLISGTPTAAGTYDVILQATNGAGTGTATLHLVFGDRLQITGDLNLQAYLGRPYYYQVATTGQATSFQVLNLSLPAGLTLDPATGLISGTPTVAGNFRFQVEATNAVGSDEKLFGMVVAYDATLSVVGTVSNVSALLLASDGNLYGTIPTSFDLNAIGGLLFKLTPDGTVSTLYQFNNSGPRVPSDLHQAADGSFYGTTAQGGANSAGTIFKLTGDGTMTTLADLPAYPPNSSATPTVLLASDGAYYVSAAPFIEGFTNPGGWIYRLAPDGVLTTLHVFNGTDGFHPSTLIQATDGNFYGTAYKGGNSNLGIVFRLAPDGTLTTLHNFSADEGYLPLASLVQGSDGSFYGTTSAGGAGKGTVFKMTADGVLTTLHTFVAGEGNQPTAALVQGSDGNFYGTASGYYLGLAISTNENSIIFKMTPDGTLTTLHTFIPDEGKPTSLPLVPDGAGNFFGFASDPAVADAVFKETPTAVPLVYAPPTVPVVTLAATVPLASAGRGENAAFTVSLSAPTSAAVTVGAKKIKAGKTSQSILIIPQGDLGGMSKKKVDLVLLPGKGYTVGTQGKVKVTIVAGR